MALLDVALFVGSHSVEDLVAFLAVLGEVVVIGGFEPIIDVGIVDLGMELGADHLPDGEELRGAVGFGENGCTWRSDDSVVVPLHPWSRTSGVLLSLGGSNLVPPNLGDRRLLDRSAKRLGNELAAEANAQDRRVGIVGLANEIHLFVHPVVDLGFVGE